MRSASSGERATAVFSVSVHPILNPRLLRRVRGERFHLRPILERLRLGARDRFCREEASHLTRVDVNDNLFGDFRAVHFLRLGRFI